MKYLPFSSSSVNGVAAVYCSLTAAPTGNPT